MLRVATGIPGGLGRTAMLVCLVLFSVCCGRLVGDEGAGAAGIPLPASCDAAFAEADSLALCGEIRPARALLLDMLARGDAPSELVLYRLVGLHHSVALEDECVELLDSLEGCGYGSLWGWKVSVLDLAERPVDALRHVPEGDALLECWLEVRAESEPDPVLLPVPVSPAERYVRALLTPPGLLTNDQLEVLAADASLLPELRPRVLSELEFRAGKPGPLFDSVIESLVSGPMDPDDPRILRLRAIRADSLGGASEGLWSLVLEAGSSLQAGEAALRLMSIAPSRWGRSWRAFDAACAAGAREAADSILAGCPSGAFSSGARMAVLYSLDEDYAALLALSDSCLSACTEDSLRARAALYRARALRGLGRSSESYAAYVSFASSYLWHPVAREAAYLAGRYYDSEQRWGDGARAHHLSLMASGTWEGDERGFWRCGFCYYMSGDRARADSIWAEGVSRFVAGLWEDEMLYWRGRLHVESGDMMGGERLYEQVSLSHPWEFYGILARDRLGRPSTEPGWRISPPSVHGPAGTSIQAAVKMVSQGYGTLASSCLADAASIEGQGERAWYLAMLGEYGPCLTLLRIYDTRLRSDSARILPDRWLPAYFPLPYRYLIEGESSDLPVPVSMLWGVVREESYFNRFVTSVAGARGLIQLMPGTAGDVARWYGLPRLTAEQFYDPYQSVRYGIIYINRQYESFAREVPLFVAAYNAGPGNASRWRDMHGYDPRDPELYLEQITYRETRIYVKKVMRSGWIYGRRFEGS
ncbi:lytic transglycosylase domain-containing protein [Candidatus Fermentibacterales bacterium]|nr:lytic transglycosylase domain-containing protein [Candidatus Fermentibacterales bacterium]